MICCIRSFFFFVFKFILFRFLNIIRSERLKSVYYSKQYVVYFIVVYCIYFGIYLLILSVMKSWIAFDIGEILGILK